MTQAPTSHRPGSSDDRHDRKHQVLARGTASAAQSIADALVIKDRDVFFLCRPDGEVPVEGRHGFGLYYNDCRFLRGYELRLADGSADRLASSAGDGNAMSIELTNPGAQAGGSEGVPKERIGVAWHRRLDGETLTLRDTLGLENFGVEPARFPLRLRFDARFEDVFDVRGLIRDRPGTLHAPAWHGRELVLGYDGADARTRTLTISFSPAPQVRHGTEAGWDIELGPRERRQITVSLVAAVTPGRGAGADDDAWSDESPSGGITDEQILRRGRRAGAGRRQGGRSPSAERFTAVRSNSRILNGIVHRSLRDLQILRSDNAGAEYFAAGVPWFVALFGRDSVITSIESLAYDPAVAEQTLRVLAAWQGERVDDYRDEAPGKILHELRVGELARIGAVPHHPFYGSVDSTPLFCLLVARHAAWTGSLDLFRELGRHVDAALEWIDRYGDSDGDGFVDYGSSTSRGLVNQGWKDSGDGIVNADGSLATAPIALVEVQGYVFAARRELADLYERTGDHERAGRLRARAEELRRRFEERFWMEDAGTYALALQRDGRACAVVSSNPGQALWTGIVAPERAHRVRDALMTDDMFSGWGVRTLSRAEKRYNPIGYHLGTVWPHDNAMIAAGLRRYGFADDAHRIAAGIADAAAAFPEYRLPEVFSGYPRARFDVPVHYPVACHPQAWAAGSVPSLLTTLLGLEPDAFAHELHVVRPMLVPSVDWLELRGLRVGAAQCDLRFDRTASGISVEVLRIEGDLRVTTELGQTGRRQAPARARSAGGN